jgi:hypothetical protein
MISITQLAVINLVIDGDQQKIEIIPKAGFDFIGLLSQETRQQIPALVCNNFGYYFEQQIENLELRHYVYRQQTYQGLRHYDTGDTILYWNSNNKAKYLNVSVKTSIIDPLLSQIESAVDVDTRFSKTKRVRMYGKEEIDIFLKLLTPKLIEL